MKRGFLSAAIMLAGIIWISTNKDRWKIETSGKGVEVSTKDGTVTARDTQTGTSVRITPDGMQIRITRQEISRIVGWSREMAGRILKSLEQQGLVSVKGKTIVVYGTR